MVIRRIPLDQRPERRNRIHFVDAVGADREAGALRCREQQQPHDALSVHFLGAAAHPDAALKRAGR